MAQFIYLCLEEPILLFISVKEIFCEYESLRLISNFPSNLSFHNSILKIKIYFRAPMKCASYATKNSYVHSIVLSKLL